MNAISHAATALLLKKRWPDLPLLPALVSVQLIEFMWVAFNLVGLERTTVDPPVRSMADVHLAHMPWSHSVASTLVVAALAWVLLAKVFSRPAWAWPVAVGVCSHLVLDILTHAHDIEILPGITHEKIGSGLYAVPAWALLVEIAYGVLCWRVFRGSPLLLGVILAFNLAAISFYVPQIPGPEGLLAGHPKVFAGVILVHIVAGLAAIGWLARDERPGRPAPRGRG